MTKIENQIKNSLNKFCDRFISEKIGSSNLYFMPPKDKVPNITHINYEKANDFFEISFKEAANEYQNGNGIDFSKDDTGCLLATRIKNFSTLDDESNMENVILTIEKEMEYLSENINSKPYIVNYIVDKRILIFLKTLIKYYYFEIKRKYCN